MGQKTHPKGFRLGITENWDSRWFAKQDYARMLHQDLKIREFIRERLQHAGVPRVEIERSGNKVKVHRIVAATDCGYAVNPAQIERQVSGSFVYGLSALFMQECTVRDGRIVETNFHEYPSMRIAQMPKVESIIIQGGGDTWGGVGEPTICVAAPAVLNALYKATGKRIRSVPLRNHGYEMV